MAERDTWNVIVLGTHVSHIKGTFQRIIYSHISMVGDYPSTNSKDPAAKSGWNIQVILKMIADYDWFRRNDLRVINVKVVAKPCVSWHDDDTQGQSTKTNISFVPFCVF